MSPITDDDNARKIDSKTKENVFLGVTKFQDSRVYLNCPTSTSVL